MYVRGVDLTPSLRLTLVHELTHALQDQVFNLDFSRTDSDGQAFALRALAEGDAIRVENAYYDSLSEDEQSAIDDQSAADVGSSKALNSDSATILLALFGAPYDLGVPFVRLLATINGALDDSFRTPPTSEENVFDPASFLVHDDPLMVDAPKTPSAYQRMGVMGHEVGVTPLQMTLAMAAIANGGKLITPRVVKSITTEDGKTITTFSPGATSMLNCSNKGAEPG